MERFTPFWYGNKIEDEVLVFHEEKGEIVAHLAFNEPQNLVIKDREHRTLVEGVDYVQRGNTVVLRNPALFHFKREWLDGEVLPAEIPNENAAYGIKGCLLVDPVFLQTKQLLASYTCTLTPFPDPILDRVRLPHTYEKLKREKKLKIALFGDSISNAANSSFSIGLPGFEHWITPVLRNVEKTFEANVEFINVSRSGYGTEWGISAVEEKFGGQNVDLAIIAFGMNDGAAGIPPQAFVENLQTIMQKIKEINPKTEFILVATPLPNPNCKQVFLYQKDYIYPMAKLACDGIAVVDMTTVTEFFLQRKDYIEIGGNNLNHPNDFFYKVYEEGFSELFCRLKESYESRMDWQPYFETPVFERVPFSALPSNTEGGYILSEVNGVKKKTFAFIAYPEKSAEKSPAVVLVHGAGGNAFYEWAQSWAKKGYVAISLDINCTHFTDNDVKNRKPNPDAGELQIGGFAHLGKDPYDSWIYCSVAQAMLANSYLRSLPFVDESKVGLVGISWGGVICLNTLGVDHRFAAGVIIYSSGFITEDLLGIETGLFTSYANKRFYDSYFDPRNYVAGVQVPVLLMGGLDDGAFSPISRRRTGDLFAMPPKYATIPSLYHDNASNFSNLNAFSFMNTCFGMENSRVDVCLTAAGEEVTIEVSGEVNEVYLCVTESEGDPHKFVWTDIPCKKEGGRYAAKLPATTKYYMAYVRYGEGLYASTKLFKMGE